ISSITLATSFTFSGNSAASSSWIVAFKAASACARSDFSGRLSASETRASASCFTRATRSAGGSTLVHSILGCRISATSSLAASSSSRMPLWATSRAFTISASVSSSAPPSTITIESFEPDTTMSTSENSSCWKVGFRTQAPSTVPPRTAATGPSHAPGDTAGAAGDLAGRVGFLAVFDGQGEEREGRNVVRHGHCGEHDRLPELHEAGARGLFGQAARLELQSAAREVAFYVFHHIACLEHKEMREAPRCSSGAPNATPAVLMAETQLVDELPIPFQVVALQILEQAPALRDHLEEAALPVEVLGVHPEVIGEAVEPLGEQRDLDRG